MLLEEDSREEPPTSEGSFEDWLPEVRMNSPSPPPNINGECPSTMEPSPVQ